MRAPLALALLSLAALLGACRSSVDPEATRACRAEAAAKVRASHPSGPTPGVGQEERELCEACCRARGLSSVEPGYCECGKLGLDALMK